VLYHKSGRRVCDRWLGRDRDGTCNLGQALPVLARVQLGFVCQSIDFGNIPTRYFAVVITVVNRPL
jgi:hypothetical protein